MNIHEKITLRGQGEMGLKVLPRRPEDKYDLKEFFKELDWFKGDLTGETLYIQSKTISQSKLRDKGFYITRSKDKGIIVIDNCEERWGINVSSVNEIYNDLGKKYTYVLNKDLYKYLYKYKGDLELFNNLNDLIKSTSRDNIKIAMEMMSNADWSDNEIYLQELFWLYYRDYMRGNQYKNSISFKGFLEFLDFNYENLYLKNADDYRALCKNDSQHKWVFDKYIDNFKIELDQLMTKYKIVIKTLEYDIDKSLIKAKEDENDF